MKKWKTEKNTKTDVQKRRMKKNEAWRMKNTEER